MRQLQDFAFWLNEKVRHGGGVVREASMIFPRFLFSVQLHVSSVKQQLLLHIAAAKIAWKLDESQAGRQLEALRQPARRTVLWMSFCQTQSQGRFVFDNSIKASFSPRRIFFFFS